MRYGKVNEAIWTDSKFSSVSDSSKLFYVYLLSCSSCNSIGLFRIGLGLIEDEFGHDRKQITGCISELEKASLIEYSNGWLWFSKFLRWNEPISPNHARKCAADLNDSIMKGAPKEAVENFLASVKPTLSRMKIKNGEKTYFDEFMSALDVVLVSEHVGGDEAFRKCISSGTCGINRSPSEALDKGYPSTSEALGNKDNNNNKYNNNNNTSTRQDNTRLVGTCDNGEPSEILMFCSDGQPHALGRASVSLAMESLGESFSEVINALQKNTMFGKMPKPDASTLDQWFIRVCALGGTT